MYVLGILSTIFPILGMSADDSDSGENEREKTSSGTRSLVINCIVLEFLASVWGLLLAGPVAVAQQFSFAASKIDRSNPNAVVPVRFVAHPRHAYPQHPYPQHPQHAHPDDSGAGFNAYGGQGYVVGGGEQGEDEEYYYEEEPVAYNPPVRPPQPIRYNPPALQVINGSGKTGAADA